MLGYLGLGSNQGERRGKLEAAIVRLSDRGVRVLSSSSTYDTDPVGDLPDQPPFLNACLRVSTSLDPQALLAACKAIEVGLGRPPGGPRHGPRPIDIDVLLLGGLEHATSALTLPHPQVLTRRFVLIPLLELDFALRTPAGASLADALAGLPVTEGVRLAGPPLRLGSGPGTDSPR